GPSLETVSVYVTFEPVTTTSAEASAVIEMSASLTTPSTGEPSPCANKMTAIVVSSFRIVRSFRHRQRGSSRRRRWSSLGSQLLLWNFGPDGLLNLPKKPKLPPNAPGQLIQ